MESYVKMKVHTVLLDSVISQGDSELCDTLLAVEYKELVAKHHIQEKVTTALNEIFTNQHDITLHHINWYNTTPFHSTNQIMQKQHKTID